MNITASELKTWLLQYGQLLIEQTEYLTKLDSAIGDADHGVNMQRGATAMRQTLTETTKTAPSELLEEVAEAVLEGIGGAAGPLYASLFFGMAGAVDGETSVTPQQLGDALQAGVDSLAARGRAERGDKTMFDAAGPAIEAFRQTLDAGDDLNTAIEAAESAANLGRDETAPMQARKGRASYLGPRSVGHIDPGATSVALLFEALTELSGTENS